MAEDGPNPFERGQLRREATDWFVRMRSADAEALKPEFNAWLARGALNRAFYNRVANLYGAGKNVKWESLPSPQPVKGAIRWTMLATVGTLLLISLAAWRIVIGPLILPGAGAQFPGVGSGSPPREQLTTRLGEIRRITLSDGSSLVLDTDTLVTTDFRSNMRELRLERGRARFEVAHERRPFVVDAGSGEVVAHGTIFDVSLENDQADVTLLRGAVDVTLPVTGGRTARTIVAHLRPGEGVKIPNAEVAAELQPAARERITDWPSGLMDFDNAALADVVLAANRYSTTKMRLASADLDHIEVSGSFHVDGGARLADQLARLFGLSMSRDGDTIILASGKNNSAR